MPARTALLDVFEDDGPVVDEAAGGDGPLLLVVDGREGSGGRDAAHAGRLLRLRLGGWLRRLRLLGLKK